MAFYPRRIFVFICNCEKCGGELRVWGPNKCHDLKELPGKLPGIIDNNDILEKLKRGEEVSIQLEEGGATITIKKIPSFSCR